MISRKKRKRTLSGSENMSREGALVAVDGRVGEGGGGRNRFDGEDAVDRVRGLRLGDTPAKIEGRGTMVEAVIFGEPRLQEKDDQQFSFEVPASPSCS